MIAVTGANGFVGQRLCELLTERGMPYRGISRRSHPGCIAVGDISASTDWQTALDGVSTVIHLAARVHVMNESAADPLSAFRQVNVDATLALARQASEMGVRRFVFVSSVKVNGESTLPGQAFSADDAPNPQDPYGYSKAEAEAELTRLSQATGMELVIARPPLVYGAGVRANFAALIRWAGSGIPSPFGACDNRRSMVFIDNLCDLLLRVAVYPDAAGEIFLVSDGKDLSVREIFARLAQLQSASGWQIPVPVPLLRAAAAVAGKSSFTERLLGNLQVDIGKTCRFLDWTPPVSCEEGLRRTVDGIRQAKAAHLPE
jgi:UDP-glucose 4-epimerase